MISFLVNLLVAALVIMLAALVLSGISVRNFGWAIVVALLVGLIDACIFYLLDRLGFAAYGWAVNLIVNTLSIWLGGKVISGFKVKNLWWALACAAVIALCQWLVGSLF